MHSYFLFILLLRLKLINLQKIGVWKRGMMLNQQKMLKREMDSFFLIPIIHMKITVSRFFLGWQCYMTQILRSSKLKKYIFYHPEILIYKLRMITQWHYMKYFNLNIVCFPWSISNHKNGLRGKRSLTRSNQI